MVGLAALAALCFLGWVERQNSAATVAMVRIPQTALTGLLLAAAAAVHGQEPHLVQVRVVK